MLDVLTQRLDVPETNDGVKKSHKRTFAFQPKLTPQHYRTLYSCLSLARNEPTHIFSKQNGLHRKINVESGTFSPLFKASCKGNDAFYKNLWTFNAFGTRQKQRCSKVGQTPDLSGRCISALCDLTNSRCSFEDISGQTRKEYSS